MAEKEVRLTRRVDQTIWGRFISTIGRVFYSSNFSVYNLVVAMKRNAVLKMFPAYEKSNLIADAKKRDRVIADYRRAYTEYLDILEKYVKEYIYAKVKNCTSTFDEQKIMTEMYGIAVIKGKDNVDYKNRLNILLLNMEWSNIIATKNDDFVKNYKSFYLYNIEELYRASMRHAAVLLANVKYDTKEAYNAIYKLIDAYIKDVLPISDVQSSDNNEIINQYKKKVATIDNFDDKKRNEYIKELLLLEFSGKLFKFSFPNVAREQCYREIITALRVLITNEYVEAEKYATYEVLLDAIEELIENILISKNNWVNPKEELEFNKINKKWTVLKKLARIDFESFKRQREILFIDYDLYQMDISNIKLPEINRYYRERKLILHALKKLKYTPSLISGKWVSIRHSDKAVISQSKEENTDISYKNVEKIDETPYNIGTNEVLKDEEVKIEESDNNEEVNNVEESVNYEDNNQDNTIKSENIGETESIVYISNINGKQDISNIIYQQENTVNNLAVNTPYIKDVTSDSKIVTYSTEIGKVSMPSKIAAKYLDIPISEAIDSKEENKIEEPIQNPIQDSIENKNAYSFKFDSIFDNNNPTNLNNTDNFKKFGFGLTDDDNIEF